MILIHTSNERDAPGQGSGCMAKWRLEIGPKIAEFVHMTIIKSLILVDFLSE
jgi:hypothetical protein